MGSDIDGRQPGAVRQNFNPRSRMGSDIAEYAKMHGRKAISIHAPAWGATRAILMRAAIYISIHAPAWGATRGKKHQIHDTIRDFNPRSRMGSDTTFPQRMSLPGNFNPRSRMGSDQSTAKCTDKTQHISIHAPAWGATLLIMRYHLLPIFQSTLPHGERPVNGQADWENEEFQSTLPHGERRRSLRLILQQEEISIHAPAWGATYRASGEYIYQLISIHAPAWGATLKLMNKPLRKLFQSTLPHGERPLTRGSRKIFPIGFQSTLPHGERPIFLRPRHGTDGKFQSTLPHGERLAMHV
jgi:hypothetical protein